MDQETLESILADLHLPAIRFLTKVDSTNDEAWRWIATGAPDGALVIADEQTAGRGRMQRRWVTAAGSGLAFSLILRSPPLVPQLLSRLTGLGALAPCQALRSHYSLPAQIKWPNDVLLAQQKAGGVLVEAHWNGEDLEAAVIGIGINVAPESINPAILPADVVVFPVTCVQNALGCPVDRIELLHAILQEFFSWLPRLASQSFIRAWEDNLAYQDQWVQLSVGADAQSPDQEATHSDIIGKEIGLTEDGALQLQTNSGKLVTAQVGEVHLRPIHVPPPE